MYYTLENKNMKIVFTNFGASIVRWVINGKNIILTHSKEEYYLSCPSYCGNTIGPISNRVSNGCYYYKSKLYNLDKNENNITTLHSGKDGYSCKKFNLKYLKNTSICFFINTNNVDLDVVYTLDEFQLKVEYIVNAKELVPISLTNHTYFNLDNSGTINNHYLKVYSNKYLELDSNNCATGSFKELNVSNKINNNIYDYGFIFDSRELKPLVSLKANNIKLDIESTMDNIQVYTGDYLGNSLSKFKNREGVALEPQKYPNAVNKENFPNVFIEGKNKDVIIYKISLED